MVVVAADDVDEAVPPSRAESDNRVVRIENVHLLTKLALSISVVCATLAVVAYVVETKREGAAKRERGAAEDHTEQEAQKKLRLEADLAFKAASGDKEAAATLSRMKAQAEAEAWAEAEITKGKAAEAELRRRSEWVATNHGNLKDRCQSAIEDELHYPRPAERIGEPTITEGRFGVKIIMQLRARNAFNALRITEMGCVIDYSGNVLLVGKP